MPLGLAKSPALANTIETLAIGAVGGIALASIGFPAGLIAGSMLAVAAAALLQRPMQVPGFLMRACYIVVGIQLGAVVTPQTVQGFVAWPASIALLAVATAAMMVGTATYLRLAHGWQWPSALMGASPGAMSQVIALSSELRADLPAVAIVQTMRLLLLTAAIPAALALFGLAATAGTAPALRSGTLPEVAIVIAVSTAAAFALWRLRFPAGLLFGAMLGSGVLHGTGLVAAALPWWISNVSIIVLGAIVGSRFARMTGRTIVGYLGAALGSFAVSVLIAGVFALAVARLFAFPVANVLVAFSPGALDTMMVVALALRLDPVYVGAHHVARFAVTTLMLAATARYFNRKRPS